MKGKDLANVRKSCGISQKELATMLGISHQTVNNWEAGRDSNNKQDADPDREIEPKDAGTNWVLNQMFVAMSVKDAVANARITRPNDKSANDCSAGPHLVVVDDACDLVDGIEEGDVLVVQPLPYGSPLDPGSIVFAEMFGGLTELNVVIAAPDGGVLLVNDTAKCGTIPWHDSLSYELVTHVIKNIEKKKEEIEKEE